MLAWGCNSLGSAFATVHEALGYLSSTVSTSYGDGPLQSQHSEAETEGLEVQGQPLP